MDGDLALYGANILQHPLHETIHLQPRLIPIRWGPTYPQCSGVFISLPVITSWGVNPGDATVDLSAMSIRGNFKSQSFLCRLTNFLNAVCKVRFVCYTRPELWRWPAVCSFCCMPKASHIAQATFPTKWGSWSESIHYGRPNLEKVCSRSTLAVVVTVLFLVG